MPPPQDVNVSNLKHFQHFSSMSPASSSSPALEPSLMQSLLRGLLQPSETLCLPPPLPPTEPLQSSVASLAEKETPFLAPEVTNSLAKELFKDTFPLLDAPPPSSALEVHQRARKLHRDTRNVAMEAEKLAGKVQRAREEDTARASAWRERDEQYGRDSRESRMQNADEELNSDKASHSDEDIEREKGNISRLEVELASRGKRGRQSANQFEGEPRRKRMRTRLEILTESQGESRAHPAKSLAVGERNSSSNEQLQNRERIQTRAVRKQTEAVETPHRNRDSTAEDYKHSTSYGSDRRINEQRSRVDRQPLVKVSREKTRLLRRRRSLRIRPTSSDDEAMDTFTPTVSRIAASVRRSDVEGPSSSEPRTPKVTPEVTNDMHSGKIRRRSSRLRSILSYQEPEEIMSIPVPRISVPERPLKAAEVTDAVTAAVPMSIDASAQENASRLKARLSEKRMSSSVRRYAPYEKSEAAVPKLQARREAAQATDAKIETRTMSLRTRKVIVSDDPASPRIPRRKPSKEPSSIAVECPSPDKRSDCRERENTARLSVASSTKSKCFLCPDTDLFCGTELQSALLGPFKIRGESKSLHIHHECACWASNITVDPDANRPRGIQDEFVQAKRQHCAGCGEYGASVNCVLSKCGQSYHLRCLSLCGARRINEFVAAFCEDHAHLADKYVRRKRSRKSDTPHELDTPHSLYTGVGRGETEVIFSRRAKVSSHEGAFNNKKVLFSTVRRKFMSQKDSLAVGDHLRLLKVSAIAVATGRLALLALGHEVNCSSEIHPGLARAALASRDYSALCLLRNLENAPRWRPGQIRVKSLSSRGTSENAHRLTRSRKRPRSAADEDESLQGAERTFSDSRNLRGADGGKVSEGLRKKKAKEDLTSPVRRSARTVPARERTVPGQVPDSIPSRHQETNSRKSTEVESDYRRSTERRKSLRRRRFRDAVQSRKLAEESADSSPRRDAIIEVPPQEENPSSASVSLSRLKRTATTKSRRDPETAHGQGRKQSPGRAIENGLLSKEVNDLLVTSEGFDSFLKSWLPRERALHPEDDVRVALRNVAKLWNSLSPRERVKYTLRLPRAAPSANALQARAARSSSLDDQSKNEEPQRDTPSKKTPNKSLLHGSASAPVRRHTESIPAGLFAGACSEKPTSSSKMERRRPASLPKRTKSQGTGVGEEGRSESVVLPSLLSRRRSSGRHRVQCAEDVDWDDLFPVDMSTTEPSTLSSKGGEGAVTKSGYSSSISRVSKPPPKWQTGHR